MKRLCYTALVLWMLLLTRTQANLTVTLRYQTRMLMGLEEDVRNLQQQIDHTYVRGPLPTRVDETTPTPLRIHPKVGQHGPTAN